MVPRTHGRFDINAKIASGHMVAAAPTGKTATGISIAWMQDAALQPVEAAPTPFSVASLRADQCHAPRAYERPACLQTPEPPEPKPPKAEAPANVISLVPYILDAAMWHDVATQQTREMAGALTALYQNRYRWQDGSIAARVERVAVAA